MAESYYESNFISRRWRRRLAKMVAGLLPDGRGPLRLLDVGTGDGYTIRLVKPEGDIAGIDPDPSMGALAESRGIRFQKGSAYHVPFEDGSFDVVTCIEVLEHLERPLDALKEFRRVVVDGGSIVVTTPVPNALWHALWWGWTRFGPGKRWESTPHVTDLRLEDGGGEDGLETYLKKLGFKVEAEASCNLGMIAGLRATAEARAEHPAQSPQSAV